MLPHGTSEHYAGHFQTEEDPDEYNEAGEVYVEVTEKR